MTKSSCSQSIPESIVPMITPVPWYPFGSSPNWGSWTWSAWISGTAMVRRGFVTADRDTYRTPGRRARAVIRVVETLAATMSPDTDFTSPPVSVIQPVRLSICSLSALIRTFREPGACLAAEPPLRPCKRDRVILSPGPMTGDPASPDTSSAAHPAGGAETRHATKTRGTNTAVISLDVNERVTADSLLIAYRHG